MHFHQKFKIDPKKLPILPEFDNESKKITTPMISRELTKHFEEIC